MAEIGLIAEALAEQLFQVTGIRATDYVPDSINPPAAFVNVTEIVEDTFDGGGTVTVDLVVLVSRASARAGQGSLYEYQSLAGPKSIRKAIAANKDLGLGDGTEAIVRRYRSLGIEEIAAYGYIGGAFETEVTTPA